MTLRECAIVEAYTGIVMCAGKKREEFYKYVDEIMGRPLWTHEHYLLSEEIKKRAKPDFLRLCAEAENHTNEAE